MVLKKKKLLAEIVLLLVTVIWGSGFVVVKNATDSIPPGYIVAIRFWMAGLVMALIFCKRLKKIDLRCLRAGAVNGVFLFLSYYLQTKGVEYTTAGNNAFLTTSYVVFVPFVYWLVKKRRPDLYHVCAAFLCIVGISLISLQANASMGLGDLLSLLCGVAFAAHIVSTSILTEKNDPILLTILQFLVTAILATAVSIPTETFPPALGTDSLLALLYIGLVGTCFALLMQTVCQKHLPASKASLIMSLESVFGCIFGAVFLGELITPRNFAGFLLVFLAVVLSETKPSFLKNIPIFKEKLEQQANPPPGFRK